MAFAVSWLVATVVAIVSPKLIMTDYIQYVIGCLNITFIVLICLLVKETWNKNFRECRKIYQKKKPLILIPEVLVDNENETRNT